MGLYLGPEKWQEVCANNFSLVTRANSICVRLLLFPRHLFIFPHWPSSPSGSCSYCTCLQNKGWYKIRKREVGIDWQKHLCGPTEVESMLRGGESKGVRSD